MKLIAGYTGTLCQTRNFFKLNIDKIFQFYFNILHLFIKFTGITACTSNPCQNGGNCVENGNAYTCNCPVGYSGTRCEICNLNSIQSTN